MDKPSSPSALARGGTRRHGGEFGRRNSLQSNVEQFKLLQAMAHHPTTQKHVSLTTRASALAHDPHVHARRVLVPLLTPPGTGVAGALFDRNSTICNAVIVLWNNKCKLQAVRQWREFTVAENARLRDLFVRRVRAATKDILVARASSRTLAGEREHARADVDTLVTWAVEIQTKSFVGVKRPVIEDVVQHMALRSYSDKACLFMEGDVGQNYYILFSGTVGVYVGMPPESRALAATNHGQATKLIRTDPSFLGQFLYYIPEGDGFGEVAMFASDARRTASAVACGPCEVIEIPKEVYHRTLRAYHFATYSKAQKIAFLPSVDIFADWLQAKIAAVSDLLERHELSFGYRMLTVDRPIDAVYFVVSGDIHVTQRWHEPVPDQPVLPQFKAAPRKSIDIQVERVTRRGVLGLPLLLSDGVKAKVDATVVTATADVYILKATHLAAFRALLPTSGAAQTAKKWQAQDQQRSAAFARAVAALRSTTRPAHSNAFESNDVGPGADHDAPGAILPGLPIMVSTTGKKFLVADWDLLVDRSDKPVPTVFTPSAPPKPKVVSTTESHKIASQNFTDMASKAQVFQWSPHGGFQGTSRATDTDVYMTKDTIARAAKATDELRSPTSPTQPRRALDYAFHHNIYRTRQLARAIVQKHHSLANGRSVVEPRQTSYKHSF